MAFCVRCGKKIPEGIVFCPYCGANLKELMAGFEEAQTPPVQEQPAQMPLVQEQPVQTPPYTQQGYRPPYYTQQEDLGYLHVKKQAVPARGMGILGRILGILGMISSIIMMMVTMLLTVNYMEVGVREFLLAFEDHAVMLFAGALEGFFLSLFGVVASVRAARRGNTGTAAGKRMGGAGLVLSSLNLVDLILCLIVLLMG